MSKLSRPLAYTVLGWRVEDNRHRADEIVVSIDRPKLLPRLRPLRGDMTAAHDAAGLHLEDVGKVATKRDLKLKVYPLHAVVRDVEILMHAAIDPSARTTRPSVRGGMLPSAVGIRDC